MTHAREDKATRAGTARRFIMWGAWCVLVLAGFGGLTAYSTSGAMPGRPATAASAGVEIAPLGYTLVMSVHPRCPCTDASLYDLEQLQTRCGPGLHVRFLVYVPKGQTQAWAQGSLWDKAARVPGAVLSLDPDGERAARLGASKSGSVVLFDASGEPRFWGGITSGRGMAGDSAGADAIAAIVLGETRATAPTKVYGCPLCAEEQACPAPGGEGKRR